MSPPEIVTIKVHSGRFHADDCFGVCVLKQVILQAGSTPRVVRSRDDDVKADFVVDVGFEYDPQRGLFDHHQEGGAGYRESRGAEPYAAFGLVWKEFGSALCGNERIANLVDTHLVRHVDAVDCGIGTGAGYSISNAISAFNPCWDEPEQNFDRAFDDACEFATMLLLKEIGRAKSMTRAIHRVRKSASKSRKSGLRNDILVLNRFAPWKSVVANEYPEVTFVVFPDTSGCWVVHSAPISAGAYRSKLLLPASWAGMTNGLLDLESGIPGGVFCHRNRHMAVHSSKEGAIAMAELALGSPSVNP